MFSALTKRNKILIIIGLILFAIALPLTIIQGQKQQEIRQRAAPHDTSLYFTKKDSASPLTSGSLNPGRSDNLSLWIDTNENSINGFEITISATNLIFLSSTPGSDANNFNIDVSGGIINGVTTLRFAKFDTESKLIVGPLRLIDFTVAAGTIDNGNITVTSAKITPPKDLSQQYLSSENPSLSYTIKTIPTPTPNLTGLNNCKNDCSGTDGSFQQLVCVRNCEFKYSPTSTPAPTLIPIPTPTPRPTFTITDLDNCKKICPGTDGSFQQLVCVRNCEFKYPSATAPTSTSSGL